MTTRMDPTERETIINFDEGGGAAFLFTYKRSWQTHCEKVLGLEPAYDNGHGGREYEMPKTWVRKPRKTRTRAKKA